LGGRTGEQFFLQRKEILDSMDKGQRYSTLQGFEIFTRYFCLRFYRFSFDVFIVKVKLMPTHWSASLLHLIVRLGIFALS